MTFSNTTSDARREAAATVRQGAGVAANASAWSALGLIVAVGGLLSWRFFRFIARKQVNILFRDQWDYYNPLFQGASVWTLFRWQHGPHRLRVGGILTGLVADLSRWDSVMDAVVAGVVVVLCVPVALLVKARLSGRIDLWDALVPLLFLTLRSFEIFVITPDMSHGPVPLLLLMLFGLCLTLPGLYLRTAGLLALNALSVYTGFGILLGLITPFLIAIEAGRRAVDGRECVPFLALCVVVAVATLAAFMVGYRYTTAVACFEFPHPRPWEYFPYAALMLSLPFGWLGKTKISVLLGLGTLATLLALVVTAARRAGSRDASGTSSAVLLTFAGFTTLFVANATVGRICQGVETSQASRYVLYLVPGLFAIYLALRLGGGWARRLATVAFAALLITGELRVHAQYRGLLRGFCGGKARWRACYLQRADIAACDRLTHFTVHPSPQAAGLDWKLDYLKRRRLNLFNESGT
ncbi:MAG: hypothetical protein E6J55_03915 [Deltaproteobacteria bacterium]|nr:MAG: hypothetical protein E6J55_03915 [Deltaproteobacteria bacterium]